MTTELAIRFRELRKQAGLTGTALASPRYTVSYVSQIEAGRRTPSTDAMQFFASKLGVSAGYLATGVPDGLDVSLRYRLEEARGLIQSRRFDEAERLIDSVEAESEQYGKDKLIAAATLLRAEMLRLDGRYRDAIDAYERAVSTDTLLSERDKGTALAGLAVSYRSVGDLSYAASVIESFLGRDDAMPLDPAVATELYSILVSIYFERGDIVRAERCARRALAAADEETPLEVRASAYWTASRIMAEQKMWDEALDLATRARVLMEEMKDRRQVARLHNAYAFICLEAEPPRIQEAREHLDAAEAMLDRDGSEADLAYVLTERSRLALIEGKPKEALRHAERAQKAVADPGSDALQRGSAMFLRGKALAALDRRDEAKALLEEAAGVFREAGAKQREARCWRELGELSLAAGDTGDGVEALRRGLDVLESAGAGR